MSSSKERLRMGRGLGPFRAVFCRYLQGRDGARGLFMTLGLLAMYGMASHLVVSAFWGG